MQRIELHSRIMEAVKLGDWTGLDDMEFCIEIAKVYGCKPLETDVWNFYKFLFVLYGYGKVQGKREERARRKKNNTSSEVAKIAEQLNQNSEICHLMKMVIEDKTKKTYNSALGMLNREIYGTDLKEIKIYPCFAENPPKPQKMKRKVQYFEETGALQSQIILDSQGYLIDGYTSYLLARAHGIQRVSVRYGRRQIVRASHTPGGKMYSWELPGLLIDRVSAGDRAVVRTERGVKVVTVAAVEEYAGNETKPLKRVIKVKRKRR